MTKHSTPKKRGGQPIPTTKPAEPAIASTGTTGKITITGPGITPGTTEETSKTQIPGTTKPAPGTTGTPGTAPAGK